MEIQRPWAFWRRVQYIVGLCFVCLLTYTGVYFGYLKPAPTCSDGIQNADERGVDCGGACERICAIDIQLPVALWAQSFEIVEGQYSALAYVENRNKDVGSPTLMYTFSLYDGGGVLIAKRSGVTVLPPDGVYPVFEGRIDTGAKKPVRTEITFGDAIDWKKGTVGRDQFELERRELVHADSKPELTATLRNNSLDEATDVEVVATIFNSAKQPLTATRTFVKYFPARSTQDITFTWPEPIAKTVKSCEVPTDVVLAIDLSGSMNNDGGTPPEPIASVRTAAEAFVRELNPQDQVGLVTYATRAQLSEALTKENDRVAAVIAKLSIDPKEELGSTNIGEALMRMQEELNSSRHNDDARKVAILLTDGLATAPKVEPEQYAQTAAEALKATGVDVYTIGLGKGVNETFLKTIASDAKQFYKAPTINDLSGIYSAITKSICEDGPTTIEIIPKPKTSFK